MKISLCHGCGYVAFNSVSISDWENALHASVEPPWMVKPFHGLVPLGIIKRSAMYVHRPPERKDFSRMVLGASLDLFKEST